MILPKLFYQRPSELVARELLGTYLVAQGGQKVGRIIETEAYPESDPAAQTYRGITKRNQVLFGESGRLYIYMTYGMHYCINVVTGPTGEGAGVLIRAVEPIQGLRGKTDGPAKLTKAFGFSMVNNGQDLTEGDITIRTADEFNDGLIEEKQIKLSPRVGISKNVEALLNFKI